MEWLLIPAAYLVGSLQWGLYVVRITRGVDIRAVGSGRTGSTNVLRTSGKAAALIVLTADFGKGAAITAIARIVSDDPIIHAAVASAVVFGHIWPALAGFRGGRGVATGVGTATAVDPIAAAVGIACFVPSVALTRYVSLGSVAGVSGSRRHDRRPRRFLRPAGGLRCLRPRDRSNHRSSAPRQHPAHTPRDGAPHRQADGVKALATTPRPAMRRCPGLYPPAAFCYIQPALMHTTLRAAGTTHSYS